MPIDSRIRQARGVLRGAALRRSRAGRGRALRLATADFLLDTALSASDFSLPALLAFADPGKMTFGSDFPYAPLHRGVGLTRRLDVFATADHEAINRRNAEVLFPRLAVADQESQRIAG